MFHTLAFSPASGGGPDSGPAASLEPGEPRSLQWLKEDAERSIQLPFVGPLQPPMTDSKKSTKAAAKDLARPARPTQPSGPSLVSRVRNRLFPPKTPRADATPEAQKRGIGFQASIAELLLINRLKALGRRDQSAEIMERASHVVFVTCQNWFTEPEAKAKAQPHKTRL